MNSTHIFFTLVLGLLFVSCDYESYDEENTLMNLEPTDRYVRLITGAVSGETEVTVGESDTTSTVVIENQFNADEDVTVEYALGGTATYGEIYTIEGASASGGTVEIPFANADVDDTSPARGTVTINYLIDTLMTAPQTITFELVSATDGSGNDVAVGQGPLRRNLVITLVND